MANKAPPQLTGSVQADSDQIAFAAKQLGFDNVFELRGGAVLIPSSNKLLRRSRQSTHAIAMHTSPTNLHDAFVFHSSFSITLQAIHRNPKAFDLALQRAKKLTENVYYHRLSSDIREYAFPHDWTGFARQLLLAGGAKIMIPYNGESTGALDGLLPSYNKVGQTMASTIFGYPFGEFQDHSAYRTSMHPLVYANPRKITKHRDHLEYGNQCAAYWHGVTSLETLPDLLKIDADIHLYVENIGKQMYVTAVIRKLGTLAQIEVIEGQLRGVWPWERIKGADLMTAFRVFVGGGSPPPGSWHRHRIPETSKYLNLISAEVTNTGDLGGLVPAGKRANGSTMFFDPTIRGTIAFIGQQQSGKTTLAVFMALCQTPYVVVLQQTAIEGEAAPDWVKLFGGHVINLDLPDAENPEDERKLFQADEQEAKQVVALLLAQWQKDGKIGGLPLLVRPVNETLRNSRWMNIFDQEFRKVWAHWTEKITKSHEVCVIIVDDVVGIPERKEDAYLLDMPVKVGDEIRLTQRRAINTAAKQNTRRFYTAHDQAEFKDFPHGFYKSLTAEIELQLDNHATANISDPRAKAKKAEQPQGEESEQVDRRMLTRENPFFVTQTVDIRLPKSITDVVGRKSRDLIQR